MEVSASVGSLKYLPWEPMFLLPIGDIQFDGPNGAADLPRLRQFIKWGMDHNAWFIGLGDFVDFLSPSNRTRLAAAGLYDTASDVIDRAATQLENELLDLLAPTRGHWLGLLQGHHYFNHSDGTTSDTRAAKFLATTYLGDCALIRVTFRKPHGGAANLKIWAHHGHGGGGNLPTAGLNKLYHQKVRYPNVRLFLMGHVPQLGHVVTDGLDITDRGVPHITHVDTHYVLTGGFARSYQQGHVINGRAQGGYAEKAMMPPAVLGAPVITLTPESGSHIDIKVSS